MTKKQIFLGTMGDAPVYVISDTDVDIQQDLPSVGQTVTLTMRVTDVDTSTTPPTVTGELEV